MNWNIVYDESFDYVHAYQSGSYSVAEENSFLAAIFSAPFWNPGKPLIIDYTNLSMENFGYACIEMAKFQIASQHNLIGDSKLALLCDSDEKFGVGRQLQSLVQCDLRGEVAVFRDELSAVEWITCL